MLIDWFTVSAQVINFLILVWLMKHFLYQPILNAIDDREQRIAKELANADSKKSEAEKEQLEFHEKNEKFEKERSELFKKATDDAKTEHENLISQTKKSVVDLKAKHREALINEENSLKQAISQRAQKEVFEIAKKTLKDLAGASLEEQMAQVFTKRLSSMDDKSKESLQNALNTNSDSALLRSAFELPSEQRTAIQNAVNQTFSAEIPMRFETAPDLISGIELTMNGQKLAWSISDYLDLLSKGVSEILDTDQYGK